MLFYSFSVSVTAHKHILHMHYETATVTPSSLGSCGFVPHASLPLRSLPAHLTSASFNAWVLDIHRKQHALNWHIRVPSERTPHSTVCSYLLHVRTKQTACLYVNVFLSKHCVQFLPVPVAHRLLLMLNQSVLLPLKTSAIVQDHDCDALCPHIPSPLSLCSQGGRALLWLHQWWVATPSYWVPTT